MITSVNLPVSWSSVVLLTSSNCQNLTVLSPLEVTNPLLSGAKWIDQTSFWWASTSSVIEEEAKSKICRVPFFVPITTCLSPGTNQRWPLTQYYSQIASAQGGFKQSNIRGARWIKKATKTLWGKTFLLHSSQYLPSHGL